MESAKPGTRQNLEGMQSKLPGPLSKVPLELLAVAALMVGSALWLGIWEITDLGDAVDDFGDSRGGSLLWLGDIVALVGFAAALIYLAWRIVNRDARARSVAYVFLAGYALAVLFAEATSVKVLLFTMLMLLVALVVLAAVPAVRTYFDGAADSAPTSHAAIITLLRAFTLGAAYIGAVSFVGRLISNSDEHEWIGISYLIVGILMVAVAVGLYLTAPKLASDDPKVPLVITGLVAAYMVLMAILEGQSLVLLIVLFLGAGACTYMWLSPEGRAKLGRLRSASTSG